MTLIDSSLYFFQETIKQEIMTRVVLLLLLMFIQLVRIRANYPFLEEVEKVE